MTGTATATVTATVTALGYSYGYGYSDRIGRGLRPRAGKPYYPAAMRIMATGKHPARSVDPFGRLPCPHDEVVVHITDRESMGEDLVECRPCGYAMRLADLYEGLFPKGGIPGAPGSD